MDERLPWARYLPRSAVLRDSGLSCRGAGEHQGGRPPMALRRLSTHALLFVTAGDGVYVGLDGRTVRVVAPAVVWLFPGIAHRYGPTARDWTEHWVLFEGVAVRGYEALGAWRPSRPVRSAADHLREAITPSFAALRATTAVPGPRAELLAATSTHALIGAAVAATRPTDGPGDVTAPAPSAADAVVASALGPATVAERARAAGCSPDELRRRVAEETSLSVHELVIRTRIARAQQLLASTDLPVGGVARQVGYDDPAYFSRLFADRVGTTPTAFRRQAVR